MSVLSCAGLTKRFGGVEAVADFSLDVEPGGVTSIIGPNGAGKTTLFNMLCGVLPPTEGHIRFRDRDVTGSPTHRIAALGLARTFQNLELFGDMSVRDHLLVGRHHRLRSGMLSAALRLPRHFEDERRGRERVEALLDLVGLRDHADWRATALPYGLQRRVELARALAGDPALVLLDEPMAGLSDREAADVGTLIRELIDRTDVTVLLVEHHIETVMTLSDRVVVLNFGVQIADGPPDVVRRDPEVVTAYLGEEVA